MDFDWSIGLFDQIKAAAEHHLIRESAWMKPGETTRMNINIDFIFEMLSDGQFKVHYGPADQRVNPVTVTIEGDTE